MTYRLLTDLAVACRKSGLKVVEIPDWQRRGRPASTGGFNPRGIVAHHTGGGGEGFGYAAGTLVNGVAGLPGPLCQLGLGRDGTVYVIAAGRANHAGRSRSSGFMAAGDGNSQAIGIEAMNSGYEGWSAAQLDAYHRLCAALCDHYGWPRSHVLAHAETSTAGKWDPGVNGRVIDMNAFRRSVASVNTTNNGGFLMALSAAEQKDLKTKIDAIYASLPAQKGHKSGDGPIGVLLKRIDSAVRNGKAGSHSDGEVTQIIKSIPRVTAEAVIAAIPSADADTVRKAVEQGMSDALRNLEVVVAPKEK